MSRFEYKVTIVEQYLDTFGHLNHAAYLTLFEEARWDIINRGNYGIETIQKTQIGPTILKVEIKYSREIKNREEITIVSEPQPIKGKVGSIRQKMINKNGEVCSEIDTRKPVSLYNSEDRLSSYSQSALHDSNQIQLLPQLSDLT